MARPQVEVTYILAGGAMQIRHNDGHANTICDAAKALGARYFVMLDGHDNSANAPIWSIFETRRIEKMLNEWVLPVPLKTFTAHTSDAAVMYAVSKGMR